MILIGYLASLLIGLSLGLIGGGGSILTLPVLVYLFGVSPTLATAYSLFIVGTASLVGAWPRHQVGSGALAVIVTLFSAIVGTWTYGLLRDRLPH